MTAVDHFGFIVAAYGVTAVVLGGLIAWIVIDGRVQKAALADLDRRGVRRRASDASR